jgi:hypothetical protein
VKSTVKTVEQALGIVAEIVAVRKRWGRQGSVPYSIDQIMDAIVLLAEDGALSNKEELTKLRRQLAASENRQIAMKNRQLQAMSEQKS